MPFAVLTKKIKSKKKGRKNGGKGSAQQPSRSPPLLRDLKSST